VRRREFIKLVGGAAAGWPLAVRAQPSGQMRRIGILLGVVEPDARWQSTIAAFEKRLEELGWSTGQNIRIDYRWAGTNVAHLNAAAKELVDLKPDLIVAQSTPGVAAVKGLTRTIPVVFITVSDPVGSGFVESLARPGGNITGFTNLEGSLGGKWVELLKEIAPQLTHAGLMFNPDTAPFASVYLHPFDTAARAHGIEPLALPVRSSADILDAITGLARKQKSGLALVTDIFLSDRKIYSEIISLVAKYGVPSIYPFPFYITAGGLISYGIDTSDVVRRAPDYVDRILRGAQPADLPVQLPIKFDLVVNLKTAISLGLTIPSSLLATANDVIE
jgi:putative tryptophan/tyrosine transport system substrate-binding protein